MVGGKQDQGPMAGVRPASVGRGRTHRQCVAKQDQSLSAQQRMLNRVLVQHARQMQGKVVQICKKHHLDLLRSVHVAMCSSPSQSGDGLWLDLLEEEDAFSRIKKSRKDVGMFR